MKQLFRKLFAIFILALFPVLPAVCQCASTETEQHGCCEDSTAPPHSCPEELHLCFFSCKEGIEAPKEELINSSLGDLLIAELAFDLALTSGTREFLFRAPINAGAHFEYSTLAERLAPKPTRAPPQQHS